MLYLQRRLEITQQCASLGKYSLGLISGMAPARHINVLVQKRKISQKQSYCTNSHPIPFRVFCDLGYVYHIRVCLQVGRNPRVLRIALHLFRKLVHRVRKRPHNAVLTPIGVFNRSNQLSDCAKCSGIHQGSKTEFRKFHSLVLPQFCDSSPKQQ